MATYYGRAGGGNWSAAGTWSLTSGGGATGATPTAADNIILDASSGAITIDGTSGSPSLCRSLVCTGYTGTLTHAANTYLQIGDGTAGNLTLVAGMTYAPNAAARINFVSTATGNQLTSGGKTLPFLNFSGSGSWALQAALVFNNASTITHTGGGFDTNNYNITSTGTFTTSGAATRSLTLGSSLISVGAWNVASITGLTVSAGTSDIRTPDFRGGGLTYYTHSNNSTAIGNIRDGNTFTNVTRVNGSNDGGWYIAGDLVITGALTITDAGDGNRRQLIATNTRGVPRTITAASVSVDRTDFEGIIGAGAASWNLAASLGGAGDVGNNSGITFSTPINCYWVHPGGTQALATNNWKTTSGGATAARLPLPQDTAIFDANSFSAAGAILTASTFKRYGELNFTGVTNSPQLNCLNGPLYLYRGMTLGAGMILNVTNDIVMRGYGTNRMTFNGIAHANNFTVDAITGTAEIDTGSIAGLRTTSGTAKMVGTLTCSGALVDLGGNFQLQGNTINLPSITFNSSAARTFDFGSGTVNLTGTGTLITYTAATNLTVAAGTSTIRISNTSASTKAFNGLGLIFYNLDILGASGAGAVTISGSNTFNAITLAPLANVRFTASTTQTVTVPMAWLGTSGNLITVASSSGATNATISVASGTVASDYLSLTRITAAGNTPFYAGANSTNGGNNTNWLFVAAPTGVYGSLIKTQDSDTVSALGKLTVKAMLAKTQANDTISASGKVAVKASAVLTQSSNTVAAAGRANLRAYFAKAQDGNTLSAQAVIPHLAAVIATQDDNALSAAGKLGAHAIVTAFQDGNTLAAMAISNAFLNSVRLEGYTIESVLLTAAAPALEVSLTAYAKTEINLIGYIPA